MHLNQTDPIMTNPIKNRRDLMDDQTVMAIKIGWLLTMNASKEFLFINLSKASATINQSIKPDLLIIFLDLLKHRVELFLLNGRNEFGADAQSIDVGRILPKEMRPE